MELTAIQYGKTELAESQFFKGGNPAVKRPIALLFFLIQVAGRNILVDAGCDTMPGFTLFSHQSPKIALEKAGLLPEEVTDVIVTHSHHDHIDGVRHFPRARVYIHENGLCEAKPYLSETQEVVTFSAEFSLIEGVTVIPVEGHCPGSCVVKVETKEQTFLLAGDECYSVENITTGRMTGSTQNEEKSRLFLQKYQTVPYTYIMFHEPHLVGEIGHKKIK